MCSANSIAGNSLTNANSNITGQTDERMVIIGASYAESWPADRLGNYKVLNRGVGGEETADMLQRFERDALSENPDAVLIWGFINDIFRANADNMADAKKEVRDNIQSMISMAAAAGIRVIVATEVTTGEQAGFTNWVAARIGRLMGKTSYQDYINGHVQDVNQWLLNEVASEEVTVVDFQAALAGDHGMRKPEYTADDGSHLTDEAYKRLSAYSNQSNHFSVKQDGK